MAEAIELQASGSHATGWVKGYIAGAVAPDTESACSSSDIEWTYPTVLANTLVIAPDMENKDVTQCLVMSLPPESTLREVANLRDNDVLGKEIAVYGRLGTYMSTFGILDNYGNPWEFRLEDYSNPFGESIPPGDGSETLPWNTTQVLGGLSKGISGWVRGYIVGYVPDVSIAEAVFGAPATVATNILIAATADVKETAQCVPVQLPAGDVRTNLNLKDHPENLSRVVSVFGTLDTYYGVTGVKSVTQYEIAGGGTVTPPVSGEPEASIDENFDASTNIPKGWTQSQISGNKSWYIPTFNGNNYATMTGYKGTAPFDQWLVTPGVDMSKVTDKTLTFDTQVNGYGSTTTVFEVYVLNSAEVATATKTKLSPAIATAPASGYSDWIASGKLDLSAYSGTIYIGFRYYADEDVNYATWCLDNVKLNAGQSGGDNPENPPTPPVGGDDSDFNTFNNGTLTAIYGTYTNSTGWSVINAQILAGVKEGEADSRTNFAMFGDEDVYAVCLNGRTEKLGVLTSATLLGGCKTLSFDFGHPYTDTKYSLTVNVKQAGNVVFTKTLDGESPKFAVQSAKIEMNVSGDFFIEIINNGPSGKADGNKDRVAIWNLVWTK